MFRKLSKLWLQGSYNPGVANRGIGNTGTANNGNFNAGDANNGSGNNGTTNNGDGNIGEPFYEAIIRLRSQHTGRAIHLEGWRGCCSISAEYFNGSSIL